MHIVRSVNSFPGSRCLSSDDCTVSIQVQDHRVGNVIADIGSLIDHKISSDHGIRLITGTAHRLSLCLIRQFARPSVLVHQHLMYARRMIFRAVVKTGMVDQILSAVLIDECRVMSGRHVRAL